MPYIETRIDVTDALPADVSDGARIEIAAWIFPPDRARAPDVPTTIALLNGGGYDKRYHHFQVPGRSGYSAAEALAARGHMVILPDHLGVGDSSRLPVQKKATRRVAALANHAAVTEIYRRLADGSLDPSIPAMPRFLKVGGGHSMGASQSLAQQADHQTYDRLMVIGYTAIGVHMPFNGEVVPVFSVFGHLERGDYHSTPHHALREGFHWDDVPDDVVEVDDALGVEVPHEISNAAIRPNVAAEDAGRIAVPVYICLGEKDVSPRPYDEPGFYSSSKDVTLHILPRSGHCQTFASTRMEMIDRIDGWIRGIPV